MVAALREMADKIESGNLKMPEYIMVMPKIDNELVYIHMGDEVPMAYTVGTLYKLLTRLSLGG